MRERPGVTSSSKMSNSGRIEKGRHKTKRPAVSGRAFCSIMAEGGRFELPVACATTDFESVTFGLSDTPPGVLLAEDSL